MLHFSSHIRTNFVSNQNSLCGIQSCSNCIFNGFTCTLLVSIAFNIDVKQGMYCLTGLLASSDLVVHDIRNNIYVNFFMSEVESRTQGSRPRPRTQKNPRPRPRTAFPRTDTLQAKDRNARGQGQGPRTQAQVLSKKKLKKRSSQKFFKRSPQKNVFQNIFQALHKILTIQKIVLSSSRGQANFRGLEASRPRPRT